MKLMIQILLFILKLIGWILLGILGVILGILLLVLFCALRYRIDGKKEEKPEGKVRISWLFGIISLVAAYQDALLIQAKLFGKTVWKTDGKSGEDNAEDKEEVNPGSGWEGEEAWKLEENGETGNLVGSGEWAEEGGQVKPGKAEGTDKAGKTDKTGKAERAKKTDKEKITIKQKNLSDGEGTGEDQPGPKEEKKSLWEKVKDKLIAWIEKLKFSFSEICGKLRQIEEKRQWLLEKWDWLLQVVHDPKNQASVRLILRQIKKIFRHILPKKGSVSLVFGREDPYLMGKLLGYAGAAYPFTHQFLTLHPVFGENRLEGEVHIRGRIRLGVILGCVLRLLLNKNIRQKLKEVLHGR